MDEKLTLEEINELEQHPITSSYTKFTDDEFNIRLSIAKKICKWLLNEDPDITAEFKTIYEKYPMWGFYTDGVCAKRSFGVGINNTENKNVLYTQSAHVPFDNITIGGTTTENLVQVNQWSEDIIKHILLTPNPGCYIDPLGFMIILQEQVK